MIGAAPYGSHLLAGTPPAFTFDTVTVRIVTTDVTNYLVRESIRIRDELGRRNTVRLILRDTSLAFRVLVGQEIEIKHGTAIIFKGTVDKVEEFQPGQANVAVNVITVSAVSFEQILDRFFVAQTYEDMLVGDIVRSIISTDTTIDDEGITTGGVEDGFTVDRVTFDYEKASNALNRLAELGDWTWLVDHAKVLHFFDKTKFFAPSNFTSSDRRHAEISVKRDRSDYANRVYLRAGKVVTETARVRTFKGDGETQNFELDLPVARASEQPNGTAPTIKIDSVETSKVGIRGQDDEADTGNFEWFWAPDEKSISQASGLTALTSSQELEVTYNGMYDVIVQADNEGEQDTRAAVEGGTGVYERIEDDKTIDGTDYATQRVEGILDSMDEIETTVRIKTFTGLQYRKGQLVELEFPVHDVTGIWLIQRVQVTFNANGKISQEISAIQSGRVSSATELWRNLEKAGREFNINEKSRSLVLKKANETLTLTDTLTADESDTLVALDGDEYSVFRINKSRIGGARIGAIPT